MTDPSENSEDIILPFQLEGSVLRGRLVRLGPAIDAMIGRHAYPPSVARLLAETVAVTAALASALKLDGVFTLQAKSDGPVSMLVADATGDGALRACAQFDAERLAETPLLGAGTLVFTVDQSASHERYQGIVKLEGESLAEALQTYFRRSEQIPTGLMVAARQDAAGAWRAGCLMIQRMPREGGHAPLADTSVEDDWLRCMALMQSCTPEELTDKALLPEGLLYRLFHEEGVRVYDKKNLRDECRCSRERLQGILSQMPAGEVRSMAKDGKIEAACQFCGRTYVFSEEEIRNS